MSLIGLLYFHPDPIYKKEYDTYDINDIFFLDEWPVIMPTANYTLVSLVVLVSIWWSVELDGVAGVTGELSLDVSEGGRGEG